MSQHKYNPLGKLTLRYMIKLLILQQLIDWQASEVREFMNQRASIKPYKMRIQLPCSAENKLTCE